MPKSSSALAPITLIALLRGINVGRAKRIAMADLRALMTQLGYTHVRTLLNSGNVVFQAVGQSAAQAVLDIEAALPRTLGVSARVTVIGAAQLEEIVAANPLIDVADNPAHLLVAIFTDPADLALLDALATRDWSPSVLRVGARAAYLWCPAGVLAGPLFDAVDRVVAGAGTMRNWSTILKLGALADSIAADEVLRASR